MLRSTELNTFGMTNTINRDLVRLCVAPTEGYLSIKRAKKGRDSDKEAFWRYKVASVFDLLAGIRTLDLSFCRQKLYQCTTTDSLNNSGRVERHG